MREHILVVDDDEKITSMLRRSLAFEGYKVSVANLGQDGLRLLMEEEPQLMILDVMMPGIDGWEVLRRVREGGSSLPILMLTAKDDVSSRVKGLDIGADDYLVKPFALEELLARIRAMLRRRSMESTGKANAHVLKYEELSLDPDTREVLRGSRSVELTAKEFDLLHLFMMNPKRVLSRDTIMDKIWGFDYSGESNVLEVYINLLRQKLEEQGESRMIQTVRGAGYVLRGDGSA